MKDKTKAEKAEIVEQTIQAIRMMYHKGISVDFEIKPEFWDALDDYISSLKSQFELASEAIRERVTDFEAKVIALQKELDTLKVELTQYEWQSGHPEEINKEVLVKVMGKGGAQQYGVDLWIGTRWCRFYNSNVVAWSEIRPYGGE